MLIADVRLTGLDRDHWHVWPGAEPNSFQLGLCPLPGTEDFQLTAPMQTTCPWRRCRSWSTRCSAGSR